MSLYDRRQPVPHGSKRGCLCRDGRYSKECCGQDYYSQGIGNITQNRFLLFTENRDPIIQENGDKLFQ